MSVPMRRYAGDSASRLLSHEFQFLWRQVWQSADKRNQLPVFFRVTLAAPSRHTRETNSIADDVVELAVAQALCGCIPQIRCLGVKVAADDRISTPVQRMAGRAVVHPVVASGA